MASDTPVALVTGARAGLGQAITVALARAGYKVYAGLRDPATAGPLMEAAAGSSVVPMALDVTVPAERDRAVSEIMAAEGRIDVLVNNAGVGLDGPLELVSELDLRHVLDVNVVGAWGMTKACLPMMRARNGGHVIMISSMAGRIAMPLMGAYAASKFALEAMAESWRVELAPFGIRVVLVEPGPFKTDMFIHGLNGETEDAGPYAGVVERFKQLHTGLKDRAGDPQEVAKLVVRIAKAKRPSLRHPIGPTAQLRTVLKRVLPDAALESLVRLVTKPRAAKK